MAKKALVYLFMTLFLCASEPITPIPASLPHDPKKAALGKRLFFDTILSKDKTISCASCHNFSSGGADPRTASIGVEGKKGVMQAPTVFNAVFNFTQFWNGRASNLVEQVQGPVHNSVEMGMNTQEIEKRLNADPFYRKSFRGVTKTGDITFSDVAEAIAEYEKTLITPHSRFDRFLRGEKSLSVQEKEGYVLFKTLGCASCHNGVNIGGNSFQKLGVIVPMAWNGKCSDRYAITKREQDKNVYKVPSLRNIALTAPYFHNGSALTLEDAVLKMSYHNLGVTLSAKECDEIVAFLKTLTGQLPQEER